MQHCTKAEILLPDESRDTIEIEHINKLGDGRAADVHLVRNRDSGAKYAEKHFKRNRVYELAFQGPGYETDFDAVRSALYRRKILVDLTELWFDKPLVADAHYTRWNDENKCNILGTEYIEGNGPKPGDVNYRLIRHFVQGTIHRLYQSGNEAQSGPPEPTSWEMKGVVRLMEELQNRFHEAGLIGSEWQVEKRVHVPASNFIKNSDGDWILVDTESGIFSQPVQINAKYGIPYPAIPRYVRHGIGKEILLLFDDVDFDMLSAYVDARRGQLAEKLGTKRLGKTDKYIERLEYHTKRWKKGEFALLRNHYHLATDPELRHSAKQGIVEHWKRKGKISDEEASRIEDSNPLFYRYLGASIANSLHVDMLHLVKRFRSSGVYRFFTDFGFTKEVLTNTWRLFTDKNYQIKLARSYVRNETERDFRAGRLARSDVERLNRYLESEDVLEYVSGFATHLSLKMFDLPVISDAIFIGLAYIYDDPKALVPLFFSSALRTAYTGYRMTKNRKKDIPYATALLTGALPRVGVGAYLVQLYFRNPELSTYLARSVASKVGRHFPLYGKKDSRLEHYFMKFVDIPASIGYEFNAAKTRIQDIYRHMRGRPKDN